MRRVAVSDAEISIDDAARERMAAAARVAADVARRKPVYGRTTGVGANLDVAVTGGGLGLLRSHAGGAGAIVSAREARAMMAVRANQLLVGASGVAPTLVDALAAAVNAGAHPGGPRVRLDRHR